MAYSFRRCSSPSAVIAACVSSPAALAAAATSTGRDGLFVNGHVDQSTGAMLVASASTDQLRDAATYWPAPVVAGHVLAGQKRVSVFAAAAAAGKCGPEIVDAAETNARLWSSATVQEALVNTASQWSPSQARTVFDHLDRAWLAPLIVAYHPDAFTFEQLKGSLGRCQSTEQVSWWMVNASYVCAQVRSFSSRIARLSPAAVTAAAKATSDPDTLDELVTILVDQLLAAASDDRLGQFNGADTLALKFYGCSLWELQYAVSLLAYGHPFVPTAARQRLLDVLRSQQLDALNMAWVFTTVLRVGVSPVRDVDVVALFRHRPSGSLRMLVDFLSTSHARPEYVASLVDYVCTAKANRYPHDPDGSGAQLLGLFPDGLRRSRLVSVLQQSGVSFLSASLPTVPAPSSSAAVLACGSNPVSLAFRSVNADTIDRVQWLSARLGDNAAAWSAVFMLVNSFTGTLDELVDTVVSVSAPAVAV